jgi:transposase
MIRANFYGKADRRARPRQLGAPGLARPIGARIPAPAGCPGCGSTAPAKLEDVTETLETIPRQWKVVQHVREKFTCRRCEAIS